VIRFRHVVIAGLALVLVLAASGLAFVWFESERILRWGGYDAAGQRLVTGILVTGTPARPVIYVTSSDPRVALGLTDEDFPVDTNSGAISRLTPTGSRWQRLELVRGLPRSKVDHATNGMALSADGKTLYVAQGSNTNAGSPSRRFGNVPEYPLSAAILAVDLPRIGDQTYDLPTLDDPSRSGSPDANDPFGGNEGRNHALEVAGGPVQVYASGFRNAYDVVVTSNGHMYTSQNGPNLRWGDRPRVGPGGTCTDAPREGGAKGFDSLHFVKAGGYYGHPNPSRDECEYLDRGERDAVAWFGYSTNGLAESVEGDLIAAGFRGDILRLRLSPDGRRLVSREVLARLALPLDVTTQAASDAFPGTIWVAQYGGDASPHGAIVVLVPERRGFAVRSLRGASLTTSTSLQFGPDGRLYVSQQDGLIKAFTVERDGSSGDFRVTDTEEIDAIQSIPNHDDDGSPATDFESALRAIWRKLAQ
jgi:sugar lactone lactonase YvrE